MNDRTRAEPPVTPAAELMGWIGEICALGIRRPGHDGDEAATEWALAAFRAAGLADVRAEPVPLAAWFDDGPATLTVGDVTFEGLALPYSQAGSVSAPLVSADAAPSERAGAIVVDRVELTELPQFWLREQAFAVHDPADEFDTHVQTLPFGPKMTTLVDEHVAAGAAGYVGLLTGFPWETCGYYVPYDATHRPVTGVWLSRSDAAALDALLADGHTSGTVTSAGETRPFTSRNVVGVLPGRGDDWVVIGSHHDAPWASAVEDASGMALVVAQARYWAALAPEDRPHNLCFVLTAGHMAGGAGTQAFVDAHPEIVERCVLAIHLEHAAAEVAGDGSTLHPTGEPEPAWWFTSPDPLLVGSVHGALLAEDLRRSHVLPPTVFMAHPPTDGYAFFTAGCPVTNFLAAPMYLFDPDDTVDKIHVPSLEPLTRATIRIVEDTAGRAATSARAAAAVTVTG